MRFLLLLGVAIALTAGCGLNTSASGGTSYSYSWSPAAGLSNPSIANPVATPALTTVYVVTITDIPTSGTVTDTVVVTVQNVPPPLQVLPEKDTICAGSSIDLNVYNTSFCQTLSGSCQGPATQHTRGASNFSASTVDNPFYKITNAFTTVRSVKHQYMFRASELKSVGLTGPTSINAIFLDVTLTTTLNMTYNNLTIKMGCFTDSTMTTVFKTGLSTVYTPKTKTFTTTQWEPFLFDQAFVWDGKSNIVMEVCYLNPTASSNFPFVRYEIPNFNSTIYAFGNGDACSAFAGQQLNRRPNTRFQHCDLVHQNALSYSWSPSAGLSNSSIKNPIATPAITTSYILTATDANGCYKIDTATIVVAPLFPLSINADTTVCGDDTIDLIAVHGAGTGAKIKWSSPSWVQNDTLSQTKALIDDNFTVRFNIRSLAGCLRSDSFLVGVTPPVVVDIQMADTTICSGDSLPVSLSTNSYSCGTFGSIICTPPLILNFPPTTAFAGGGVVISPFDALATSAFPGQRKQYLFLASEIAALTSSHIISKIGFNLQGVGSTLTNRDGFTIKMGCTSISAFPAFNAPFITGLQTVFSPKTINIGAGWNDFQFDNAFVWDGSSNVVVEICWQNSIAIGTATNPLLYSITPFSSVLVNYQSFPVCTATNGNTFSTIRPDMRFSHCQSPPNLLYKFKWTPSSGLSNDTIPEPSISPSIATLYRVTVTDPSSGCSDMDSVMIDVAPDFNITATADTILCESDTVPLSVLHNSPSGVTYAWHPGSSVSNSTIANPTIFINNPATIVSEVKSSLGCIKWDTINLGLQDQVDLSVTASAGTYCEGDTVQLTATHSLKCGLSSNMLTSTPLTVTVGNATTTSNLVSLTPFVATDRSSKKQIIIRKAELISAGMSTSVQISSISFNIASLGKADYQDFTIKIGCTGLSYFNGIYVGTTSKVFGPKAIVLNSGINQFDFDFGFNWDGNSNIVIEICYNNTGTGVNSSVYYTPPSPNYASMLYSTGNSVCGFTSGTAFNGRPNIEFGFRPVQSTGYSYDWSPSGSLNNSTLKDPLAYLSEPGIYKLDLTDSISGCITSDSIDINVKSFSLTAMKDSALCTILGYQLDAQTDATSPQFKWTPAIQLSNDSIANPTIVATGGLNFILEVIDVSGCVKTDTVNLVQLPIPVALASPKSILACRGDEVQLQGSGGASYSWLPTTGLSNPNSPFPIAKISSNTIFYLTVTNTSGCTDEDSIVVTIHPSPLLNLGPDTSYCIGGSFIISAGGDFTSYLWQDGSVDSSYIVKNDGTYWVNVEDAFQCKFTDTVQIGLAPSPSALLNRNTLVCIGDSALLDAGNPGSTYNWSTGAKIRSITVKDSGLYWVEINNGKCKGSDTTNVYLEEFPVSALPEIERYCDKQNPFGVLIIAGSDQHSYLWSSGETSNSIMVSEKGTYSVRITSKADCSVEDSVLVQHLCSEIILVPNSFTPNNDWKNDRFSITALNMESFEFRIFNRWGGQIFYTTDPEFEWDGDYEGRPLPDGVYVWRIDYKMKLVDGSLEKKEAKGSITLLR